MVDPAPLTGEPLAIDLVNTRPNTADGPVDLLSDVTRLRSWLALQVERLPELAVDEAVLTDADLVAVRTVRDHIAAAVHAARRGEAPPTDALDGLNATLRAAPTVRELTLDGTSVALVSRRQGSPGLRLAAQFAEDAAGLLADARILKVRVCEAHDCVMLFLPAHPRRRWCSAARCGNRTRVARYYQRHKAE